MTKTSKPLSKTQAVAMEPRCNHEIFDGNRDDPSYAYCGEPCGHAGPHGSWQL